MTTTTLQQPGTPAEHEEHPKHNLTGFIIFLCSESVIFLAFFSGYALLKTSALNWLPDGVDGLEWRMPLVNTIVLVSSSGTIALAEHFKSRENMLLFRGFWLMSMAMGAYFEAAIHKKHLSPKSSTPTVCDMVHPKLSKRSDQKTTTHKYTHELIAHARHTLDAKD